MSIKLQAVISRTENAIFYLFLLSLPTQLGKHFWPEFSLIEGLRVDYLAPTVYISDILLVLLFIVWFTRLISVRIRLLRIRNQKKSQITNVRYKSLLHNALFILIFFYLLMTVLLSGGHGNSWYYFGKFLEIFWLAYYIARTVRTATQLQGIVLVFAIGTLFESSLAIAQSFHQASLNGIFYWFGERTFTSETPGIANAAVNGQLILRPYATFPHPNVLAGYLVCCLIMCLFLLKPFRHSAGALTKKKQKARLESEVKITKFQLQVANVWYISLLESFFLLKRVKKFTLYKACLFAALILGSIALFLTLSRTAILVWIIILAVKVFLFFKSWFGKQEKFPLVSALHKFSIPTLFSLLKPFLVGLVLLLAIMFFLPALLPRFLNTSLTDESVTQRMQLIQETWQMIRAHPLFGVGLGNFLPTLAMQNKLLSLTFGLQPVHNIFLYIAAETGVIGFIIFCLFLLQTFLGVWKMLDTNQESGTRNQRKFPIPNFKLQLPNSQPTPLVSHLSFMNRDTQTPLRSIYFSFGVLLFAVVFTGMFDHYWISLQQGQLLCGVIFGLCWTTIKV